MKSFARVTKLSNISGRANYITDPKRQENIVAESPAVDWKPYQDFEKSQPQSYTIDKKTGEKIACARTEGRDVMIALPNEWKDLPRDELTARAQSVAVAAIGKDTDMQWAVHLNSAGTKDPKGNIRESDNLHMHVVFSERKMTGELSSYDRDVYHTAEGTVARSKAQRAKDSDGNDLPPVHHKGEAKGGFTAKDTSYKDYRWKDSMKLRVEAEMKRMGATIEPPDPIHQYHEGKGHNAPEMRERNEVIKIANKQLSEFSVELRKNSVGDLTEYGAELHIRERLLPRLLEVLKKRLFPIVAKIDGKWFLGGRDTAAAAIEAMSKRGEATARPAPISEPPRDSRPDFAAVIEAQKEYYRQVFALNDTRQPPRAAIVNAPKQFEALAANFKSAFQESEAARTELYRCRAWEFSKKKAAESKCNAADRKCERLYRQMREHGFDSTAPFGTYGSWKISMNWNKATAQVDDVQKRLNIAYNKELQTSRPSNALEPSQEAARIAQERFISLLRDIPSEHHKDAQKALEAAYGDFKKNNKGWAASKVEFEVKEVIRKELPSASPIVDVRERDHKSKGYER